MLLRARRGGGVRVRLEPKEILRRVHDTESPPVRRGRTKPDGWRVQELVHEGTREMLDGLAVGVRQVIQPTQRVRDFLTNLRKSARVDDMRKELNSRTQVVS